MSEKKAFQQFLQENRGVVIKVCRIYSDNQEDFDDCFQETAIQLWKSFQSFRGESKASTWVYRVALNVCLTQLKRRKKNLKTTSIENMNFMVATYDSTEDEQLKAIYAGIKKLKEGDRAIILLYLEDKSYKEMAEILGITVSNVGAKVNRVKNQLKSIINGR